MEKKIRYSSCRLYSACYTDNMGLNKRKSVLSEEAVFGLRCDSKAHLKEVKRGVTVLHKREDRNYWWQKA